MRCSSSFRVSHPLAPFVLGLGLLWWLSPGPFLTVGEFRPLVLLLFSGPARTLRKNQYGNVRNLFDSCSHEGMKKRQSPRKQSNKIRTPRNMSDLLKLSFFLRMISGYSLGYVAGRLQACCRNTSRFPILENETPHLR